MSRPAVSKGFMNSPFENDNTVPAADIVCYLGSEALVVHEEDVEIPDVRYNEFL